MSGSGQLYRIPLVRTAVSVVMDLCEILAAASHVVWIHEIYLSQSTEIGDAQEEMLQLQWRVGNTTSGSGGNTGVVAIPQMPGQAASGLLVETFNTTKATVGTTVIAPLWDWNVRMPFQYLMTPEMQLFLAPGARGCLELVTAPTDPVTISGVVTVEVVG